MKKILLFLLVLFTVQSFGQDSYKGDSKIGEFIFYRYYFGVPTNYQYRVVRERSIAAMFDSSLHVPRYNGTPVGLRTGSSTNDGLIAVDTVNNILYFYSSGGWITSGNTYTANLPIRVTGTVISADTSVAYSPSLTTNARVQKVLDSLNLVEYNFSGLANWDKLRYNSSGTEWVNFQSTRISVDSPAIKMLVKDTVTNQEYYTDIPSTSTTSVYSDTTYAIQELADLTDLDDAEGNAAIIDGRLWIKYSSVGSWRRQAYDTTYSTPLMLDTYSGAEMAFSLRKLRSAYTGSAIRVRRSSDDAEQDIGFVLGELDVTSLTTFIGANDGLVVTWYDQSVNGNDATQSTEANQPVIVSSGSVVYDNGNPTIDFGDDSDPYYLALPTGLLNGATSLSYFQVAKITDFAASNSGVFGPSNTNSLGLEVLQLGVIVRYQLLRFNGTARNDNSSYLLWDNATQSLTSIFGNSTDVTAYKNSASVTMTDASSMPALNFNGIYNIGKYNTATNLMYGDMQELIIYITNQASNRSGIETNINTFYTIY